MPTARTDDGFQLHYEEVGTGDPLVFAHEFGGDHRSWEPQLRHFARRYRCLVYAARGYPPSEVPTSAEDYGQLRATDDLVAVLDTAGIDRAHLVGNSMGAFCALHCGLRHPDRVRSLTLGGIGYGSRPEDAEPFRAETETIATGYDTDGAEAVASWYGTGPARVQFRAKDPRGHAEHVRILAEHDPVGAAMTMRAVQQKRPALHELRDELATLDRPVLVVAGDEDDRALEPSLVLKRTLPRAALAVLPRSGHVTNLEEPELFNTHLDRFLTQIEHDRWPT